MCQRKCGWGQPSIVASVSSGFGDTSAREAFEDTSELSLSRLYSRSEGRHLPNIAYYMKDGISRNESEGEQDTWEGKRVVAGYRRRSPITR